MDIEAAQGHLRVVVAAAAGPQVAFRIGFYTLRAETALQGTYRPTEGGRVEYDLQRTDGGIQGVVAEYASGVDDGSAPRQVFKLKDFVQQGPVASEEGAAWSWPDPQRLAAAVEAFEAADDSVPPPMCGIVAVGSSGMREWHGTIAADLAPLTVLPRGIDGSNMNDVLHYVDRLVLPYEPRAVLLYAGAEDVAGGVPPEAIKATFEALVGRLHAASSQTQIYVLSGKPSLARWDQWPQTQQANRLLKAICAADPRLVYIDVATPMLGADGRPRPAIFAGDGLHLNPAGYALWTAAVRPVLIEREAFWEH